MNSFRGTGICPLNPKAISPEKLIPASVYVRVESDDDPNESNLALQTDSLSLDDSNSNPVEPSTSSGSAKLILMPVIHLHVQAQPTLAS